MAVAPVVFDSRRLGRHLGSVFICLSGLLWRAYTLCDGFHPRIGQSGKALLADPNQDRRKKVSKSSLGEEVSDDDVLSEECFKRSCQGYLFLAQYISLSFFLSDSSLACFDERSPRNTDVFRFSCFLIFNIFFYSSLCVSLSIFFLKK